MSKKAKNDEVIGRNNFGIKRSRSQFQTNIQISHSGRHSGEFLCLDFQGGIQKFSPKSFGSTYTKALHLKQFVMSTKFSV